MAVEILILSGARQGDRVVLDATSFRAGTDPGCDVRFDPRAEACGDGRSASFALMEDGWYIVRTAGSVIVNQKQAAGITRIRSGDIVRLSENGPDFSFSIAAAAVAARKEPLSPHATTRDTAGARRPLEPPAVAPADPLPAPGAMVPAPPSFPATITPPPQGPAEMMTFVRQEAPKATKERWVLWVVAGIGGCAVLALMIGVFALLIRAMAPGPANVNVTVNTQPANTPGDQGASLPKQPESSPQRTSQPATDASKSVQAPEERLAKQIKDAVFLVQVEKAGRFWALFSCCAIGKNTLLTTAREALLLDEERDNPDLAWKAWITNQENGLKLAVKDIYVNSVYLSMADKPDNMIYYDFALMTVAEDLPQVLQLASTRELDELDEGLTVYCCSFGRKREKITKHDTFKQQLVEMKILAITEQPESSAHHRRLQMKGKLLNADIGMPILNDQGKIVALYADATQPAGMEEIHLAPVLIPEIINAGLRQRDGNIWIKPGVQKSGASEAKDKR
jgi:hypothetical protein